jgi:tryptophan synthase alpha subunit
VVSAPPPTGARTAVVAATLASWGADGVSVGSTFVRALGEAPTPEEGLVRLKEVITGLRGALPPGDNSFWGNLMRGKLF